jgi:putative ABC transport system permease protein
MTSLVRKTLWREWRRFLPAVLAICFTGLLLMVQAALVLGIFGSAALYVNASSAALWVGYPGTQSVNLGRGINRDVEMALRMQPDVTAVEPLVWLDSDWRGTGNTGDNNSREKNNADSEKSKGAVSVFVVGINPAADGMAFDHLLKPELRLRLQQPGAVIVDRADLDQLGVRVGDAAWIDGHRVSVIGVTHGMRALGGVNVLASVETARNLDSNTHGAGRVTYLLAGSRAASSLDALRKAISGQSAFGPYEVWTAREFAEKSELFWIFDTGAGVAVLFLAVIVLLVGIVISSQALMAVVISSVREYATLNALGVGMSALRRIVLEQATWIGGIGLLLAGLLSTVVLWLAHRHDVPVAMTPAVALFCALLVMVLALASGLIAMRGLLRADPALLLR